MEPLDDRNTKGSMIGLRAVYPFPYGFFPSFGLNSSGGSVENPYWSVAASVCIGLRPRSGATRQKTSRIAMILFLTFLSFPFLLFPDVILTPVSSFFVKYYPKIITIFLDSI